MPFICCIVQENFAEHFLVIIYAPLRQCSTYPHIRDKEVRHREGPDVPSGKVWDLHLIF